MLTRSIIVFFIYTKLCYAEQTEVVYSNYDADPATDEEIAYLTTAGQLGSCTHKISLPCNDNEWRRLDGSCNNLKKPSRGTSLNPLYRLLPANFYNGNLPRKTKSNKDLKPEREIRVTQLKTGKSVHPELNINVPGFGIFAFVDVGSIHDIKKNVLIHPNCCARKNDFECASLTVSKDDPVHRFDGITCLNMTRPIYYQDYNCTDDPVPAPITESTQFYDLSMIYTPDNIDGNLLRSRTGGELLVHEENGLVLPVSGPSAACVLNEGKEQYCFKYHLNGLQSMQLNIIWFYRNHNFIAKQLAKVNPQWDDETLFQQARNINIAIFQHIYFYEWTQALIATEDLVKFGVISKSNELRDMYDPNLDPGISLEYLHSIRFFHIMQETNGIKYDTSGNELSHFPLVNMTFRTGYLALDNNMVEITQGFFRQPTKDFDHGVDFDISEQGLGGLERATDVTANDLSKARLFGLAPYVDYIHEFFKIKINNFEDLVKHHFLTRERVAILKLSFDDVRDVDLLAGLWNESPMKNGRIPRTLAYIIQENMLRSVKTDRFWHENPKRPHAFNAAQLKEIKKVSIASIICNVGDQVTEIVPKAFFYASPKNPITPCEKIPHINYEAWRDVKQ